MLPPYIYERLPSLYLLMAIAMITLSEQPLLWFAGCLLFIVGAITWMMRSSYRRTDLIIFPDKRWLQPEWLYEAQPFIWLALGLLISQQPAPFAPLALLPCLWACSCLWARHRYRHHVCGATAHLRRDPARRRLHRSLN
ncbi:hypothetical protein [Aeromonas enteropelogenes]|uniref:hypothetical protein n=1 Tax=Aeromonas enteropelogenes TaxID=29489 RepID=UPI0022855308|nr:hypothetical protein [Aeromonas enteropelogenes]MCZ0750638.1 hypothetical protein [Aeromonas enteropelogenes]